MHLRRVTPLLFVAALSSLALVGCSLMDGPTGRFPGGALRDGPLITEADVSWEFLEGDEFIELQLVDPTGSRTTGMIVHDGELYVPVDLGFIWRRVPAPQRWMLATIYRFKHWHEDALRDGRVVLRVDGRRYPRQAVRVTDATIVNTLRSELENGAAEFFGTSLGAPPQDPPNDVWFFRMDPRSEAARR